MRNLFNLNTLNIFTDASVKSKQDGNFISCAGAVCVITKEDGSTEIVDQNYIVLDNATNNRGEIYAVYMGVLFALKYRNNFEKINIISDSQFAIYGLTRWIYNWKASATINSFKNGSKKTVANQDIFKLIINTIIMNKLYVNFYHQKGHANKSSELEKARSTFYVSNGISLNDFELQSICYYNDIVDINSRYKLNETPINLRMPLKYPTNFNDIQYKKLINN